MRRLLGSFWSWHRSHTRIQKSIILSLTFVMGSLGNTESGSYRTFRFLAVGKTSTGETMALGQEVTVLWRGQRKLVRWNENDVKVKRGRGVLMVDGQEVKLKPFDPLEGQIIFTAAFDGASHRIVVIREGKGGGPSECRIIKKDGGVSRCKLPEGYYFDIAYQYRDGNALRYFAFENKRRNYREIDVTTGEIKELNDALSQDSLTHPPLTAPIVSDEGPCAPDGAPLSPDGRVTVWQCNEVMECRGDGWTRQVRLAGALPKISQASPLSSPACLETVDAVAETPWESFSSVWSHSGSHVYWCGKGWGSGYVVDRNCETVKKAPCLRVATWTNDDSAVIGVTKCGHEITEWPMPTTLHRECGNRGGSPTTP